MESKGYNQLPNKRIKTMSGKVPDKSKGSKDSAHKGSASCGMASAFLEAEKEFQKKPEEEWKVQKGRSCRQNKPFKPKEGMSTNLDFGGNRDRSNERNECRGRGSKKQSQNLDFRNTSNKRSTQNSDTTRNLSRPSQSCDGRNNSDKTQNKSNHQQRQDDDFSRSNRRPDAGSSNQTQWEDRIHNSRLYYTKLQQISAKDSTDIIRTLANSRSGLDEFLSGKIKPDCMYLIVKILSKLTKSDWEENKEHVIIKAATPEFFKNISDFVLTLATDEQDNCKRRDEMEQFFDNLLTFFHAVMTVLPTVAAEQLTKPLRVTKMVMENVTELQHVMISANLLEKMKQLMTDFEERKKEKEEWEKVKEKEKIEPIYPKPLGHIDNIPLYPRPEDIVCARGSIVPNKIVGPYNNVEHYLDVHFRLLREDFIAPVRQGINEYRIGSTHKKSSARKKVSNIRIYARAKFLRPKVIADKVGYDICFDPEKRLKVNWEHSKRFIYGSLLLFTTDNFHTFFLATVVKRDLAVVEKERVVSVVLCDTSELAKDILSKEFLMAESEVYFEPYHSVLKALQKFNSDTFPMKRYFVYVETKTERPAYTRNGSDIYTIQIGKNGIDGRKTFKIFDDFTWPSCDELGFDLSQMNAFKSALTNDLAVIQGPPGTGKTYLGLKIAGALLENSVIWNYNHKTPILVICYTNHALDQFLEGILQNGLTNNVVRIGGRSQSEILEQFNLRERRKSVAYMSPNYEQANLLKDLKREMSGIFESIKTLQDNLEHLDKFDGVLSLKTLRLAIREHHLQFFKNNDDLLAWLLHGVGHEITRQKLISTHDKGVTRSNHVEEFGYDLADFENDARLKQVLIDSIELEQSDDFNNNTDLRIYFTCTLDEIQKKIEEYSRLIDGLPGSEDSIENIQRKMRDAKKAESDFKLILLHFEEKLKNTGIPTQEDSARLCDVANLNALSDKDRWALYKDWIEYLKAGYWMMIGKLEERYRRGARRYDEVRQFDDLRIVQQADVVGITTTTAARLQAMLRELKPKIVIVEEAAEVLEAHIVASLSVYCQHLILIGDHKQLRPSPSDYRLGRDFHLDVSLFERLINNGVSYHTLSTQHRMRPEISRLLVPTIYPSLSDHPSTLGRERIRGMNTNLFFMTHNHPEEDVADVMSKRNLFEARMAMMLARHLLLQGYRPDEVTVLTTYNGQMYLLKDEQKRLDLSKDLHVTVVDNFQGEENKIIILSLVRSNADNRIGFLKTENRVCVALSRARDGLFVFGNMDCLTAETTQLWQRIRQSFIDQNAFGPALVLRCETHRSQITRVVSHNDFHAVMEGGCSKPCNEKLPCGHLCKSLCHVSKDRHTRYRCSEPCIRFLCKDGHICTKKCYEECGQCKIPMRRTLACGHQIMLQCCVDYSTVQCKQKVTLQFKECGHQVEVECFRKDYKHCPQPCGLRLDCGHTCARDCHVLDNPDHLEYICTKPCARRPVGCTEEHKCPLPCFEPCQPCTARMVRRLSCGHSLTTSCTDTDLICQVPCARTMACGHPCKRQCFQECGGCLVKVEKIVPLCGHKVKVACSIIPSMEDCEGKCSLRLSCGHKCAKRCKDVCSEMDCEEPAELAIALPCGHTGARLPCNKARNINLGSENKEQLVQYCNEPCLAELKCSHRCSGTCGQCMQGRIHKVCDESCGNTLICGHSCPVPCRQICPPCEKPCQNRCIHNKCPKKCGEPCVPCQEPCKYSCMHFKCTKKCGEMCNMKPCTEPCYMKLSCGHGCVGFCGEPCPPCKECSPEHFDDVFGTAEDDARWVLLNDCQHVVESTGLEHWLGMAPEDGDSEIKLKACPKCTHTAPNRYITTTQRYMNLVKNTFKDIQAVKTKMYGQVSEIRRDRERLLDDIRKISTTEMAGAGLDKEHDELLLLHIQLLKDLPVVRHQRRKEIDVERLRVLTYMVKYLTALAKRREQVWNQLSDAAKQKMMTKINMLTKALRKRDKKICLTEIESFDLEVNRIERYSDLLILESSGEFRELKAKEEVIQCFKRAEHLVNQFCRYTENLDKSVFDAIKQLKEVLRSNAELTPEVRQMIHQAMSKSFHGGSSAQGHWFKCPNGHIYVITECGGAMQKSKCPEKGCGADIGGEYHRYLPGQRVASEMDGATRPAWSSGYDMRNFDLNNLH